MLSLLYQPCSAVGGRRGCMLLHALPNQGGGLLYQWRHTLLLAEAEAKMEVVANSEEVK